MLAGALVLAAAGGCQIEASAEWTDNGNAVHLEAKFSSPDQMYVAYALSEDDVPDAGDMWWHPKLQASSCTGSQRGWGTQESKLGAATCPSQGYCVKKGAKYVRMGLTSAPVYERCRRRWAKLVLVCCATDVPVCPAEWGSASCTTAAVSPNGSSPWPCTCDAPAAAELSAYDLSGCSSAGMEPAACSARCAAGFQGTAQASCDAHGSHMSVRGCSPAACADGPNQAAPFADYTACNALSTRDTSPGRGFIRIENITCPFDYYTADVDYVGHVSQHTVPDCAERCRVDSKCSGFELPADGSYCALFLNGACVPGYLAGKAELFPAVSSPSYTLYVKTADAGRGGDDCSPQCGGGASKAASPFGPVCVGGKYDDTSGVVCNSPPPPAPPPPPPSPPPPPAPPSADQSPVMETVVAVVGGVLVLCLVAAAALFRMQSRRPAAAYAADKPASPPAARAPPIELDDVGANDSTAYAKLPPPVDVAGGDMSAESMGTPRSRKKAGKSPPRK